MSKREPKLSFAGSGPEHERHQNNSGEVTAMERQDRKFFLEKLIKYFEKYRLELTKRGYYNNSLIDGCLRDKKVDINDRLKSFLMDIFKELTKDTLRAVTIDKDEVGEVHELLRIIDFILKRI